MANIRRINSKTGIKYQITISDGRDSNGKQIRQFFTWTADSDMTENKAEKAVRKYADALEEKFQKGFEVGNKQTFAEYAEYVISNKERGGARQKTIELYRERAERANKEFGEKQLNKISPKDLNSFYNKLEKSGARKSSPMAILKPGRDLTSAIKSKNMSISGFSESIGINKNHISRISNGYSIGIEYAEKISKALGHNVEFYFDIEKNTAPLSPATIVKIHQLIYMVLEQAKSERIIEFNPAEFATPPSLNTSEKEIFQPNEIKTILECLQNEEIKWQALINLYIVTGCRRGEILALHWEDIDFTTNQIHIHRSLNYSESKGIYENPPKTAKGNRYLSIPSETMELLKTYRAYYLGLQLKMGDLWDNESSYVFVRDNGKPINPTTVTQWMNNFSAKYNLPHINPHKFRHSYASILIDGGIDEITVSRTMGHSRISTTTDIYSHLIESSRIKASECIANTILSRKEGAV